MRREYLFFHAMASEQVLEEQKEMTKTLVLYDDKGKEVMSADFVNNGEINMDDVETLSRFSTRFEIKDHKNEVLESGSITPNAKEEIKEAARKHNPKKDKSLTERIKDKKEQSQKKQNPFAYIHTEQDVLKFVNTLIANTKGEGAQSGEDFWVKAERLLFTAYVAYIVKYCKKSERNFVSLLAMRQSVKGCLIS